MKPDNSIQESEEFFIKERYITFWELFKENSKDMVINVFLYFLILISSLLRGGKGVKSIIGLETCSFLSWFIFLIVQFLCIFVAYSLYRKRKM